MTRKFAYQETLEITLNVLSEIADMIISALTLLASDVRGKRQHIPLSNPFKNLQVLSTLVRQVKQVYLRHVST